MNDVIRSSAALLETAGIPIEAILTSGLSPSKTATAVLSHAG
jgi:hypothetical protein